ncbi:hypothetical protein PtB15_16B139 [Puccinia triticina]|nr:hypothetical protein PtB15_16B139 [Puccinia triticina]
MALPVMPIADNTLNFSNRAAVNSLGMVTSRQEVVSASGDGTANLEVIVAHSDWDPQERAHKRFSIKYIVPGSKLQVKTFNLFIVGHEVKIAGRLVDFKMESTMAIGMASLLPSTSAHSGQAPKAARTLTKFQPNKPSAPKHPNPGSSKKDKLQHTFATLKPTKGKAKATNTTPDPLDDGETASEEESEEESKEESLLPSMEEISTSEYDELSGPDDELGSDYCDSSSDEEPESFTRNLVEKLLLKGLKGPKVLEILHNHGIKMHERTFTRKRREWGLQQRDLPKIKPASVITPQVRASLISSHSKGLSVAKIQARLAKETNVDVYCRTVKRYLKQLNLKLDINDVLKGKSSASVKYKDRTATLEAELAGLKRSDPSATAVDGAEMWEEMKGQLNKLTQQLSSLRNSSRASSLENEHARAKQAPIHELHEELGQLQSLHQMLKDDFDRLGAENGIADRKFNIPLDRSLNTIFLRSIEHHRLPGILNIPLNLSPEVVLDVLLDHLVNIIIFREPSTCHLDPPDPHHHPPPPPGRAQLFAPLSSPQQLNSQVIDWSAFLSVDRTNTIILARITGSCRIFDQLNPLVIV